MRRFKHHGKTLLCYFVIVIAVYLCYQSWLGLMQGCKDNKSQDEGSKDGSQDNDTSGNTLDVRHVQSGNHTRLT